MACNQYKRYWSSTTWLKKPPWSERSHLTPPFCQTSQLLPGRNHKDKNSITKKIFPEPTKYFVFCILGLLLSVACPPFYAPVLNVLKCQYWTNYYRITHAKHDFLSVWVFYLCCLWVFLEFSYFCHAGNHFGLGLFLEWAVFNGFMTGGPLL